MFCKCEQNVGRLDKAIRILVIMALLVIGYSYRDSLGAWQWLFYILALLMLWTVVSGCCMPYKWMGINTTKLDGSERQRKSAPAKKVVRKPTKKKKRR